jgi:mannosyl-3-phosphoglycerate phosphatase family protein
MTFPVIFTDLDGTLLDFDTYDPATTRPFVARLSAYGIPVIFCSSKTRREQAHYREVYALSAPFIVENGSAIYLPHGYFSPLPPPAPPLAPPAPPLAPPAPPLAPPAPPAPAGSPNPADAVQTLLLGTPADEIRTHLHRIHRETGMKFSTYDDLSLDEICQLTGLSPAQAESARAREYSATILTPLTRGDHARLTVALSEVGLQLLAGGRFHTVTSAGTDKGVAVARLTQLYRQTFGTVTTFGLGDSANDRAMLAQVDHPYLVQKPDQTWDAMEGIDNLVRVPAVGPNGWGIVAETLLKSVPPC